MSICFFTDRDLGKAFPKFLSDAGIPVEPHHLHFRHDERDEVWLKSVAEEGWYALMHDSRIRYKPNEKRAVLSAGLGLFVMVGRLSTRDLAKNFVATYEKVHTFASANQRPFIARIYCPPHSTTENVGDKPGRVAMWVTT